MFKKAKPLKNPNDAEHAYNYALFLLNLRLRTEGEMRNKMLQRGYSANVIDEIVARLQTERFVDDNRYAEVFIENMKSYKYYGYFMMKKKLMEKRLSGDLIESKLADLVTEEDELIIAKRYMSKEFGSGDSVSNFSYEEKQKIMRRLLSRGFRINTAQDLLK